jgi:hypothetical protein
MTKYVKHNTTKHEYDRMVRQRRLLAYPSAAELLTYSNPVAPPQHDHTAQLDAWAAHVNAGYIVR